MKIELKVTEGGSVTMRTPKESEGKVAILEIDEIPLKDRCRGTYIIGGFAFKDKELSDAKEDFIEELSYAIYVDLEPNDEFGSYEFEGGILLDDINIDEIKKVVEEYKNLLEWFTCSIYHLIDTHEEISFYESDGEVEVYEE